MKLAIFDIDGTVTQTNGVDSRCFIRALREIIGMSDPDFVRSVPSLRLPAQAHPNWSTFKDVTDSGIFADVFSSIHNRPPQTSDVRRFVTAFVALLDEAHRVDPEDFRQVPGAAAFLRSLRAERWSYAFATGGFGASARRKLRFAGFGPVRVPLACADDSRSRERIVLLAHERALRRARVGSFDRVVLVGDATWDCRTAAALQLPFLRIESRIGSPGRAIGDGVSRLAAFGDHAVALHALDEAVVPERSGDSARPAFSKGPC